MKNALKPRSELRGTRRFTAELGARHKIIHDANVANVFETLGRKWLEIAGLAETVPCEEAPDGFKEVVTPRHKLFDDPGKLGMTVLEMRLSRRNSLRHRRQISREDLGRTKQRIADDVSRLGLDGEGSVIPSRLPITFTDVRPVGGARRKLAFVPDQADEVAQFMVREHELIVERAAEELNLKDFSYPYEGYTPKMTLGKVLCSVPEEKFNNCIEAARSLLPVTVNVLPVLLTPEVI